jgi:hypothetical protein
MTGHPHGTDPVARLASAAHEASQIRSLSTRPDVVALRIEHVRKQVDMLLWAGVVLGLLFTMVNVQRFAAAGAPAFSSIWWTAWLLDPMVSLVLLAVLRAEQITSGHQLPSPTWARGTKWCTFAITYAMNTWEAWGLGATLLSPPGVVLHSIPPLLVVLAAETGPGLRDQLAEAARRAGSSGCDPDDAQPPPQEVHEASASVHEPSLGLIREPAPRRERRRRSRAHETSGRRRLLADYLADARIALDVASLSGPTPEVTPTWCREVTGCSAGTSVKLAAALLAQEPDGSGETAGASHLRTACTVGSPPDSPAGGASG